ncbi:MAG: hypothetical protein R3F60_23065 [bacterium]
MLRWLPLMIVVGCSSAPMLAPRTDLVSAERPQPRRERPRPRVSVEASVRVDGRRADVAAVLTFQNPDDAQAEAVVTLALPAGAIVDGVEVDEGGELPARRPARRRRCGRPAPWSAPATTS